VEGKAVQVEAAAEAKTAAELQATTVAEGKALQPAVGICTPKGGPAELPVLPPKDGYKVIELGEQHYLVRVQGGKITSVPDKATQRPISGATEAQVLKRAEELEIDTSLHYASLTQRTTYAGKLPELASMTRSQIRSRLQADGWTEAMDYTFRPQGGFSFFRRNPDGSTSIIRVDPPARPSAPTHPSDSNWHAHKEVRFDNGPLLQLDDTGVTLTDKAEQHIIIDQR
jgi:hypothetical protein